MAYKIFIASVRQWRKDCSKIPKRDLERIHKKIELLTQEPWSDFIQVKQLPNYDLAQFRLRIGNYRVLFDLDADHNTVRILRVLHRSKLY